MSSNTVSMFAPVEVAPQIASPSVSRSLHQLPIGHSGVISHLSVPHDAPDWQPWLEALGFISGEQVLVKRRSLLRQGAVVVQVGLSIFALHPEEAACVQVVVERVAA